MVVDIGSHEEIMLVERGVADEDDTIVVIEVVVGIVDGGDCRLRGVVQVEVN